MPETSRVTLLAVTAVGAIAVGCASLRLMQNAEPGATKTGSALTVRQDPQAETIAIFRAADRVPLVLAHVASAAQPDVQLIADPSGALIRDNTRLVSGFSRLNGYGFLRNTDSGRWRRVSAAVTRSTGEEVRWSSVYDLLDSAGNPLLTQTEQWSMRQTNGAFALTVEWRGTARTDVTIDAHDPSAGPPESRHYGGLVLRLRPQQDTGLQIVNAARQRNERAAGQRAMWIDIAVPVAGRADPAHIALFDYPDNRGYPQAWNVDPQLGIGAAILPDDAWIIRKDMTEVVRHQVQIFAGPVEDVRMDDEWAAYSGNRSAYATSALWGIAQREGRDARFLTAEEAVAEMSVVDGYRANAWAAEPMVVQPMAFCWDDRGRLWVAENRDYESRGRGFSSAGTSRIVILEDSNHDGVADNRTVFLDNIVFPSGIAVGLGGVFVTAPPNLLFIPDRNGDDKADVADIEVRLTGWGISDRHEVVNSLHWGPDGWLYGLEGYATSSKVRKPEGRGRLYSKNEVFPDVLQGNGVEMNGGVWRYHPTKDVFEVVAHGFSNPWGIDYDAKGQLFITACVIPHLFHVIPGGVYQRQGGQHFNPYVYSDIQTIADHRHRSAHGGARIYQSDAFPASQQGRLFMANIHEHAVLSDVLERRGSGFRAHHGDDFVLANNAQWIGFSVEIGPDGAVYVLDWHDSDICGTDVRQKETGRIFRIAPRESRADQWKGRYDNLATMTDAQLANLQTSRSDWHARRARIILQGRAAAGGLSPTTAAELRRLFESAADPDYRLRAMWTMSVIGAWSADALVGVLSDRDEYIRAWAIQLLAEDRAVSEAAVGTLARLARDDRSPVVRLYLASALQRLQSGARWTIARELMAHAEDAGDQNLPKMIWFGIESLVAANPPLALDHAASSRIPMLTRFIARRAVDADAIESVVVALRSSTAAERDLLEGMRDGLEGRYDVAAPSGWAAVYKRLERSSAATAKLAVEIDQRFNDASTTSANVRLIGNRSALIDHRRRALQLLTLQRRTQLTPMIPALLDDPRLRLDAIRSVAAFDDEVLGKLLLSRFQTFNAAEKTEAIQALASRPRYARLVADALASGALAKRDVPPHVARQLRRLAGSRFADVWGPIAEDAAEDKAYSRYKGLLNDTAMKGANPAQGRAVFLRTCGPCHTMNGEGGAIGPDLTGSNRANLEYLLTNILNPNADVPDAYKMVVVTTRDGRTYSGTIVAETNRQLTLRVVGRDNASISKSDIQSREATAVSMMPAGLLDSLTDHEAIDLIAYLRSAEAAKVP